MVEPHFGEVHNFWILSHTFPETQLTSPKGLHFKWPPMEMDGYIATRFSIRDEV